MSNFRDENAGRQLLLFDYFNYPRRIRPTDIDAVMEFNDKLWIFIEAKHEDKPVPKGQRVLLERTVQRLRMTGVEAFALIVNHDSPIECDVMLYKTWLVEYFHSDWHTIDSKPNTLGVCDYICRMAGVITY